MSSLRTIIVAILLAGWASTGIAQQDLSRVFAGCVGRFSAEMEHAWLMGDGGSADRMQSARATFLSLLDATVAKEDRRGMLHQRIEAKQAQAVLLTLASFSDDVRKSENAEHRAAYFLSRCQDMLLDS